MKVSDYIVKFLIQKGITDVFGYPGGSVTNLMESFHKYQDRIKAHVVYHEQGASFAASAYAAVAGVPGVAYATGGPGALNLLTGIGHAYYESLPIICFTGNVNVYEMHGDMPVRQKGFQESDIVSVAKSLTKYCVCVKKAEEIPECLENAYNAATSGRRGPVLVDLPMNILSEQIDLTVLVNKEGNGCCVENTVKELFRDVIAKALLQANRPCIILGNGAKSARLQNLVGQAVSNLGIPYVTSMIAFDILPHDKFYAGFIGAYGVRSANIMVAKSDLIISIGSRLDIRQVGAKREDFAPDSQIIRIDIDAGELSYKVHDDELSFCMDAESALEVLAELDLERNFGEWLDVLRNIQHKLEHLDDRLPNTYIGMLGELFEENVIVTTDVGQNQVWVAQSMRVKEGQRVLFSGGMGAMGHALPAAIGACYGSGGKTSICICGDGGLQMNIQELQFVAREKLPVKIIVFNNYALGMIRHFQEMYFDNSVYQTKASGGYTTPDFASVAKAYGIRGIVIYEPQQIEGLGVYLEDDEPLLVEIRIDEDTYVVPKLEFGKPIYDQQPLIDRTLLEEIMKL